MLRRSKKIFGSFFANRFCLSNSNPGLFFERNKICKTTKNQCYTKNFKNYERVKNSTKSKEIRIFVKIYIRWFHQDLVPPCFWSCGKIWRPEEFVVVIICTWPWCPPWFCNIIACPCTTGVWPPTFGCPWIKTACPCNGCPWINGFWFCWFWPK